MLATVLTKTVRDRTLATVIGSASVALMLLGGMAVYRGIDVSFYFELPRGVLDLMGIPPSGDVGGLALGTTYAFVGAIFLAGLAISMGSASIAGEERDGTIAILLGNPLSRTRVLFSKAGALVVLTTAGTLLLWAAALGIPRLLGVDMSGIEVSALIVHLYVNALFYGFLALSIGAWTGSATAASGASVTVMVVSYVASGMLPLVPNVDQLVRAFPWHYFSGSQPVLNGIAWDDLAVLGGLTVVFAVASLVGVNRRDLRGPSAETTLLDRLRMHPLTRKTIERVAGTTRVSRIAAKALSDHQGLFVIAAAVLFYSAALISPMFALLPEAFTDAVAGFPDTVLALVGFADMSTPEGWVVAEVYAVSAPAAAIVVTVVMGARALAGEERDGTMELLLANPVRRSTVVLEKVRAMVAYAIALGVVSFVGTMAGSLVGRLGLRVAHVAAINLLLVLLALAFGAFALLLSAATGRTNVAAYGTAVVAFTAYLADSFLQLVDRLAGFARWSPFHYYLGGEPLTRGLNLSHAGVLATTFVALVGLSLPAFARRDLRG